GPGVGVLVLAELVEVLAGGSGGGDEVLNVAGLSELVEHAIGWALEGHAGLLEIGGGGLERIVLLEFSQGLVVKLVGVGLGVVELFLERFDLIAEGIAIGGGFVEVGPGLLG